MNELKNGATFIVPSYNEEKYINYILNYLKDYERANEVIVINDGSTDNSDKVIREFLDSNSSSKFKYLNLIENRGKAYGVQEALKQTTFDKVVLTDSDIAFLQSNYFDPLIETLSENLRMVVSDNTYFRRFWFSLGGITALTIGQRSMFTTDVRQLDFSNLYGYHLEEFLQREYRKRDWKMTSKFGYGGDSPLQFEKYNHNFFTGLLYYISFWGGILLKFGPIELFLQRVYLPVDGIEWAFFMNLPKALKLSLSPITFTTQAIYSIWLTIKSNLYYAKEQ